MSKHTSVKKEWFKKVSSKKKETILFILGGGYISFYRSPGGKGFDMLLK